MALKMFTVVLTWLIINKCWDNFVVYIFFSHRETLFTGQLSSHKLGVPMLLQTSALTSLLPPAVRGLVQLKMVEWF